ncbi:hypothetical protein NDN08_005910 [Rhodosorus marinus]|uniref:J domain-containing protein n=1 Tax=Rhodosorus marinus TaxID=101924 RepID=A0AAV8V4X9_9RHOD|nr:hypothetical protein NDN08_005910 [Rhodosorus marinus]
MEIGFVSGCVKGFGYDLRRRGCRSLCLMASEPPLGDLYSKFVQEAEAARKGEKKKRRFGLQEERREEQGDGGFASNRYHSRFSMYSWDKPDDLEMDPTAWRGGAFEWEGYRKQWKEKMEKAEYFLRWNPYHVLGVDQDAGLDAIKRAFRKLARELHPDMTRLPKHLAEEQFRMASEAYELLSDESKRKEVDLAIKTGEGMGNYAGPAPTSNQISPMTAENFEIP